MHKIKAFTLRDGMYVAKSLAHVGREGREEWGGEQVFKNKCTFHAVRSFLFLSSSFFVLASRSAARLSSSSAVRRAAASLARLGSRAEATDARNTRQHASLSAESELLP